MAVDMPLTLPCYTSFEYNASGIRTKKVNFDGQDTTTTEFKVEGTTILAEKRHSEFWATTDTIRYIYTNNELVGFEYNGNPYYYRKNLFGDIVEIYDEQNQLVASYTYDAWGNCNVGMNIDGIAFVNKFRYRGYYYDSDTGYYYLQTRYYDAEVGRFINDDDVKYLNPLAILGCNIYAYCGDNPVKNIDPKGTFFGILGTLIGSCLQVIASMISYVGIAIASVFDDQIREDMDSIGWNPFNSDSTKVVDAQKVSFYKGVPVFWRELDQQRGGAFLAIFLDKGHYKSLNEATIRHEWGHAVQQMILGPITYAVNIGIPSSQSWGSKDYYSNPQEVTADMFGGIAPGEMNGGTSARTKDDENIGVWYLVASALFGPLAYLFFAFV